MVEQRQELRCISAAHFHSVSLVMYLKSCMKLASRPCKILATHPAWVTDTMEETNKYHYGVKASLLFSQGLPRSHS